jgi:hypothetical protein
MRFVTILVLLACGGAEMPEPAPAAESVEFAIGDLNDRFKRCEAWTKRVYYDLSGEHTFYWCTVWGPR